MLSYLFIGGGYALLLIAYRLYIRQIRLMDSTTAPNPASWAIFGLISLINFALLRESVSGAIVAFPAIMATVQFLIAFLSYKKRKGILEWFDRDALTLGVISFALWALLQVFPIAPKGVPIALIFVADAVGFAPILRYAWRRPEEDDPTTWAVFAIVGVLVITGIFFMESAKPMDWAYPIYETALAVSVFLTLLLRRRWLRVS